MPLTWGEIYNIAKGYLMKFPLEGIVWFPDGTFQHSHVINRWNSRKPVSWVAEWGVITPSRLHEMLLHELPAHLTDVAVR